MYKLPLVARLLRTRELLSQALLQISIVPK